MHLWSPVIRSVTDLSIPSLPHKWSALLLYPPINQNSVLLTILWLRFSPSIRPPSFVLPWSLSEHAALPQEPVHTLDWFRVKHSLTYSPMIPLLFIPFPHALFFLVLFLLTIKEKLFLLNPWEIGRSYIQNNPYRNSLPPIAIVSLFAIIHPKKVFIKLIFFNFDTPMSKFLLPLKKDF